MKFLRLIFPAIAVLLIRGAAAQNDFDYQRQDTWPENCANTQAMRQTPIDIVTANVEENDDLIPLEFDERWTATLTGIFANNGFGVRFVDNGQRATVRNHLGTYELLNFHLHWGPQDDNGTGHQIDGQRFGVEFHFVTAKLGANLTNFGPDTPGDTISVISVLAEADDSMPISGVWETLNPTMVTNAGDVINVTGITYPMVLPENRDYYYYEGSQTSPGCWEFVQWFVLRERIPVPSQYLAQLRTTRFDSGELILLNRRNVQPLFDRTVYTLPTSGTQTPHVKAMLVVVAVLLFNFFSY